MLITANFGTGKSGLATCGYALYDENLLELQTRTTSGVLELGTNTGIYGANITFPSAFDEGVILFDTGEASPRYVVVAYSIPYESLCWEANLSEHNVINTFGRRINTWPLAPIRDSIEEIVKLVTQLDKSIKRKMKEFKEFLEEKTGDFEKDKLKKEDLQDVAGEQTSKIENLNVDLNQKLETLKKDFSVLDKSLSEFSERLKTLVSFRDYLEKIRDKVSFLQETFLVKTNNLRTFLEETANKDKDESSARVKDLKDLLLSLDNKNRDTFEKFGNIFSLVKNGIEKLDKNIGLVATISAESLEADRLEEILKEEGILKDDYGDESSEATG